jgi:hypothetical protein
MGIVRLTRNTHVFLVCLDAESEGPFDEIRVKPGQVTTTLTEQEGKVLLNVVAKLM